MERPKDNNCAYAMLPQSRKRYLIEYQINMLLRGGVPVLQLRLRQQLHQGHHGFPHINDAPLLRVDVRCIHHQPLQAGKRQRPWDPISGGGKEDDGVVVTILDKVDQPLWSSNGDACVVLLEKRHLLLNLEVLGELQTG